MVRKQCILVLILIAQLYIPTTEGAQTPSITFDQGHGLHIDESSINVSGYSNIEMKSASWKLWDVSSTSQTTHVVSGDFLTTVSPVADNFWSWTLDFDNPELNCTCYLIISVPDGIDVIQANLLLYIGSSNHRPEMMLPHSLESSFTSQNRILLSKLDATVSLNAYVPSGTLETSTLIAQVCESPYWVCLQERFEIVLDFTTQDDEIAILLNADELQLDDGIWDFELILIDELLTESATIHLQVHIDTKLPVVEIEFDSFQKENIPFSIFANIDDGYKGSNEILTWTLQLPSGEIRALLDDEMIEGNQLELNLSEPGEYNVEILVRDSAGHYNKSNQSFIIEDVMPYSELYFDTMKLTPTSQIQVKLNGEWEIREQLTSERDYVMSAWTIQHPDGSITSSSLEYLNSSLFSVEGEYVVSMNTIDDEGNKFSTSFKLTILETSDLTANSILSSTTFGVIVFIGIAVLIFIMFGVKSKSKYSNDLPKWTAANEAEK
jgi:hypothetical protein